MAKDNKNEPTRNKGGDATSHIRDSFSYYPPKPTNEASSDNKVDTPCDSVDTPSAPHQKSESHTSDE